MDNPLRERRIRAAMEREASHAVPHADLWPAIQLQLRREQAAVRKAAGLHPRPPLRQFATPSHPSLAFFNLLLASLLVVSLIILVSLPPTKAPQSSSPATTMPPTPTYAADDNTMMPMEMALRAQPLHLSQTIDGYTVALDHVYLDASTLMLSYSIVGPHTRYLSAMGDLAFAPDIKFVENYSVSTNTGNYNTFDPVNSSNNNSFSSLANLSWQLANQGTDNTTVRGIASFDPPAALSTSLNLRLNLSLTRNPAIDIHSVNPELTPNQTQYVAGPFQFNFTAPPVGYLKTISVRQQATVSAVTITLAQVMLTSGQTQLLLLYSGPAVNPHLAWQPDLTLIGPDGRALVAAGAVQANQQPNGGWIYALNAPLFTASGQWTVRIDALHGYDLGDAKANETQISGPWMFQFTIPATR